MQRDLLGAGVPGLGLQQPDADVPAADEPALPGGPHRRQRGQLLPRARRWCWRPAWRDPAGARPGRPGQRRHLHDRRSRPGRGAGVRRLPWTLGEAVDAFEHDEFACEVLGSEFHQSYAELQAGRVGGVQHHRHRVGAAPSTCGCGERGHGGHPEGQRRGGRPHDGAEPVLVDMQPASEVVPGMTEPTILTSGPAAALAGVLRRPAPRGPATARSTRAWPRDLDDAERQARRRPDHPGRHCHDHGCVGSVAGIYTASMPVFVVENRARGNRASATSTRASRGAG